MTINDNEYRVENCEASGNGVRGEFKQCELFVVAKRDLLR
jgi:hypothetical protein